MLHLGECRYTAEFEHLVCNTGTITCTDPARVLGVNSVVFVKGFETSAAKCCTLGDATLLIPTTGSLVAEKAFLAPGAGKTPDKNCFALNQSVSDVGHVHVHTPTPQQCASTDLGGESHPHQATNLLPARKAFQPSPNSYSLCLGHEASTQGQEKRMKREVGQLGVELVDPHSKKRSHLAPSPF